MKIIKVDTNHYYNLDLFKEFYVVNRRFVLRSGRDFNGSITNEMGTEKIEFYESFADIPISNLFSDMEFMSKLEQFINSNDSMIDLCICFDFNLKENEIDTTENTFDPMLADCARIIVIRKEISAEMLVGKLKLEKDRAKEIIEKLKGLGVIRTDNSGQNMSLIYNDLDSLDAFLKSKGII